MKKYWLYLAPCLLAFNTLADEVDYGVYSETYNKCLADSQDSQAIENCHIEEYYRIKKEINILKDKLSKTPEFFQENKTELSLPDNIENMQKYSDMYCKYMLAANAGNGTENECKLNMANYLHADLYKIYEAIQQKRQKNNPHSW